MRNSMRFVFGLTLLIFLVNGCIVSSIHPLWTKENRIFEDKYLGKWEDPDCSPEDSCGYITLKNVGDSAYILSQHFLDEDFLGAENKVFIDSALATLVHLGNHTFLDIFPLSEQAIWAWGIYTPYIPVHSFLRVKLDKNNLVLEKLDADRLETLFKQKRIRLKHEIQGDHTILTAPTKDLVRFMKKYADDPQAFEESYILVQK